MAEADDEPLDPAGGGVDFALLLLFAPGTLQGERLGEVLRFGGEDGPQVQSEAAGSQPEITLSFGGEDFTLAAAEPAVLGNLAASYGMERGDAAKADAARIRAGGNGTDGAGPVARLRRLTALALKLAENAAVIGVCWPPSRAATGIETFRRTGNEWLNGGAFPALGLTSITIDEEGAMRSTGLAALAGQEVVAPPSPVWSNADRAKLLLRLVDDIVREGPVHHSDTVEISNFGLVRLTVASSKSFVYLESLSTPEV